MTNAKTALNSLYDCYQAMKAEPRLFDKYQIKQVEEMIAYLEALLDPSV